MSDLDLILIRSEPIQHQLTSLLRGKILSKELMVGTRLPSATELARQCNTNSFTIHSALVPLVKEGLIERRPRTGTFVCSNRPISTMVIGVYCSESIDMLQRLQFNRAVQGVLSRKLSERGYQDKLWVDWRPRKEQSRPLPELAKAVKEGAIQGLAVLLSHSLSVPWLQKLAVPSCFISGAGMANGVGFDMKQFLALGLDRLKKQGCRTVGLVSGLLPADSEHGVPHPSTEFYEDFMLGCKERGLEFRNSWILPAIQREESVELFGYRQCQKLWAQFERPEGLLVYPDSVASGVAQAIVEDSRTARPRLVFHRNKQTKLSFPPIRASWIYSDEEAVADGLILQITKQMEGESPRPVLASFSISKTEELP